MITIKITITITILCLCCSYFVCCYTCLSALKFGSLYLAVIVFVVVCFCCCFFNQLQKNRSENHFNDFVPLCHYCYTCDVGLKFLFSILLFFCFTVFLTELK